jgi:demethylmenaquinone methyltransferase / 2-methoxy-6-polyprenyl-1,4-benzoquinol methylase
MKIENTTNYPLSNYYSRIYKRYDLINRLFTLGMDQSWRKEAVEKCLAADPKKILDLCCGTGDLSLKISSKSGGAVYVTGYDFNSKMLEIATTKTVRSGHKNVKFIEGTAANMPFSNDEFDCITIGFGFRNLTFKNPDSEKHLSEISRVLKQGGQLVIIESSIPPNKIIRLFYRIYLWFFLIPLGGLISGDWKAYRYLAHSSANFYSPEQVKSILLKKGLAIEFNRQYLFGSANLIVARKL